MGAESKYEVVFKQLEKEILDGNFNENKKLPTEEELIKRFNVSKNTIRKAIEILVSRGYLYRVQGSGIFLREYSREGCTTINDMVGLTNTFPKDKLTSELINLSIIDADEELSSKMKCCINTKLYYVKRIRYKNEEPIAIEESYYNKDIIPYLDEKICTSSIYKYITEDLKLNIGFADKIISCEKIDKTEAEFLDLKEGDPAMILENTVFLNSGIVFDISKEKYNYTKCKILSLTMIQ